MGQSAEELRDNIARTRDELSGTLDAIEDRVSPNRMVERRKEQVRSKWTGMRDSVMGSAGDWRDSAGQLGGQLGDKVSGVGDRVSQAPESARQSARGNPFAVGIIAFGAGLLAAAIFPGTEAEGRLAQKVQEVAQPLVEEAKQVGQEVMSNLQEPAQDAAQQLKDVATAGIGQVKETAQQAAADTKQAGSDATSEVTNAAQRPS